MSIINNRRTIKMQLERREVVDLLIALDVVDDAAPNDVHWQALHDKLRQILDEADRKAERS